MRLGCDTIANELNPVASAILQGTLGVVHDFGPDLADVTAEYLAANQPYEPLVDGRITIVGTLAETPAEEAAPAAGVTASEGTGTEATPAEGSTAEGTAPAEAEPVE